MSALVEAANRFAVDLHKVLKNQKQFQGENLFYSPTSVSIALGMVYNGARGSTAHEIAKGFHWDEMKVEQVNQEMKDFHTILSSANSASNQVQTANRLFLQESFQVLQEFTDSCKTFYEAETALVDYTNDFEGAREKINAWVEDKTNQKIKDLLPPGSLDPNTMATLVNAIYFKGLWDKPFKKKNTYSATFFVRKNEEISIEMMFQNSKFRCTTNSDLHCEVLKLPYVGRDLSMVILLPNKIEGLSRLEEKLTHNALQRAITSVSKANHMEIEVSIPRFAITQQFQMKEVFQLMDMGEMFDSDKADLSGMTLGPEKLYVSKVIHKAFVDVNEEGTEAAAATGAIMKARCKEPPFMADHPFLFLITHSKSGAILFLGRIIKPESSK